MNLMKLAAITLTCALLTSIARGQDETGINTASVYTVRSVPTSGTSEVQTLTIQASTSGGTFTLTVGTGNNIRITAPITWSAVNATMIANVDTALERLPQVGVGGVTAAAGTLTAGIGTMTLTFTGKNAKQDFPTIAVSNNLITGGTIPTIATTTPGVEATFRKAKPGTILVDVVTPGLYFNTSATLGSPTWTAK